MLKKKKKKEEGRELFRVPEGDRATPCVWLWPQVRVRERSAACAPWLSTEHQWRNTRAKQWLRFALQQCLQLTHSHSRKSASPRQPAEHKSISPPQTALSNTTCFASAQWGERIFPKVFLFPNWCPWWCAVLPVCSLKDWEQMPYKEDACIKKCSRKLKRTMRKKMRTDFILLYAGVLPWKLITEMTFLGTALFYLSSLLRPCTKGDKAAASAVVVSDYSQLSCAAQD